VCKLKRSIYGLKPWLRCWNTALDSQLRKMGFVQSKSDPCIYTSAEGGDFFYIGVYVYDIVLAGKDETRIKRVKKELASKFDVKDLGKLNYFLEMSTLQYHEEKKTWMGQPSYTQQLLEKEGMSDCKPVATLVDPGAHLTKLKEDEEAVDQQRYTYQCAQDRIKRMP